MCTSLQYVLSTMYVPKKDLVYIYMFTIKAWGGGQEKHGDKFCNHLFHVDCSILK